MSKQKFAWKPTRVWNMKTKHYRYTWIWFAWYWMDKDEPDKPSGYHRLSDDPYEDTRIWTRNKTRMNSNRW